MKPQAVSGAFLVLCVGCLLAACRPPATALPTQPAVVVVAAEANSPTPTVAPTATATPTPTATATATLTPPPTATRTPRPTATATATPVLLGGHIVFVAQREDTNGDGSASDFDNGRIVTLDLQTGETRDLTDGSVNDWGPAWSPDGRQIAYVSKLGRNQGEELYVINSDGSSPRRLTTTDERETEPAWSPDGTEIVFLRSWWDEAQENNVGDLHAINVTSGVTRQLTHTPELEREPDWSPDGRFLAYSRDVFRPELGYHEEIFLLDVVTGEEWMLTEALPRAPLQDFLEPQWLLGKTLLISFTVMEVTTSDLGGEPHFHVELYQIEWQDGHPVLVAQGTIYTLVYGPGAYTWGPNGEWYIAVDYPGLVAQHFTLQPDRLPSSRIQWGETVILIDAPTASMTMPDWTP